MAEQRTPRGYALVHPDHLLSEDVLRLRQTIIDIDSDITIQSARINEHEALLSEQLHRQRLRSFHHFDF
ncbi:MAG TPA: hypothetical protein PLU46_00340 [Thiotrichales bacterium]|nr:hypothetical protein [Thiotrichales bacterium]